MKDSPEAREAWDKLIHAIHDFTRHAYGRFPQSLTLRFKYRRRFLQPGDYVTESRRLELPPADALEVRA